MNAAPPAPGSLYACPAASVCSDSRPSSWHYSASQLMFETQACTIAAGPAQELHGSQRLWPQPV